MKALFSFALAFVLLAQSAYANESIWKGAQKTSLTKTEADDFDRDLRKQTGGGRDSVAEFGAIRKGIVLGTCGMARTAEGSLPFYAIYFADKKPPYWKLSFPKSVDKSFGILTVCHNMGMDLSGWKQLANPSPGDAKNGAFAGVRLSDEQKTLLQRDVAEKLGSSAPVSTGRVISGTMPYKQSNLTIACGFASANGRNVPFYAVWIKKSSKGPARFGVSSIGTTPVKALATFNLCRKANLQLPGSP